MGLFSWLFGKKKSKSGSGRFTSSGLSNPKSRMGTNNHQTNIADPLLYSTIHQGAMHHSSEKSNEQINEEIQNAGEDMGEALNNEASDTDSGSDASCGSSDSSCGSSE